VHGKGSPKFEGIVPVQGAIARGHDAKAAAHRHDPTRARQGKCNSPLRQMLSHPHSAHIVAWVHMSEGVALKHRPHVPVSYDISVCSVHQGVLSTSMHGCARVLHMSLRREVGMVPPEGHHRRSVRLKGYDYAQPGAYFVTICTHGRVCIFGDVVNGEMIVNECGQRVTEEWLYTGLLRPDVVLDAFVVMPNHLHGIVIIMERDRGRGVLHTPFHDGTPDRGVNSPSRTVGAIVRGFKAATVRDINCLRGVPAGAPVWQRDYYEHVVRSAAGLGRIRAYIADNPARWLEDENNPARIKLGQGP
jgi:putative transposase